MEHDRRLSLTVGAFALVSLAALAFAIVTLSTRSGAWAPRYRLVAFFDNVQGLIAGAPVWLAGRPVGRVESVSFGVRPEGRPALKVLLQVDREVSERIRSDSMATIGTIGLLGDRYVGSRSGRRRAGRWRTARARDHDASTWDPWWQRHAGARQHRKPRRQPEPGDRGRQGRRGRIARELGGRLPDVSQIRTIAACCTA
jgi:hypothetical protein